MVTARLHLLPIVLAVALPLLAGCTGTCKNVSIKLIEECDLAWQQELTLDDFQNQCEQQELHYEDDPDAAQAFQDHLDCLLQTSCDVLEVDDSACFDEEIYIY